jgi:1-aminocyclopropane-1-carboxylate deaminase/D-cysteine desulfhydrase-like pyridoxal-dependent ACC family enzyme
LELIECPGNSRYGAPLADFDAIFEKFYADNLLELDRTYTSKVVKAMAFYLNNLRDKNPSTALPEVLYWHTFSAMASKELERKQIVPK